jgi:hypothetical protein
MPALNYQSRFAAKVADGSKYHTIRAVRVQPIQRGDWLMHYTGMRTKNCRKLRTDTLCIGVTTIVIMPSLGLVILDRDSFYYRAGKLGISDVRTLATVDGFADSEAFFDWFSITHGPEFYGTLIEWKP